MLAEAAFTAKGDLNSFWQDTAELHFPEHADFTEVRDSDDYESTLYDSTPCLDRREFGNWMGSVLRPKGRVWAKHRCRQSNINELPPVRTWLESKDPIHRDLLYDHKSNFIAAMSLRDHQYVTFGNAVSSCELRKSRTGYLFRTWHLRDCAWIENDEGVVDTMFRMYKKSVRDLCAKESQGWTIPDKIKERLRDKPNSLVNCLHGEMPIDAYYWSDRPKNKKAEFISLYICKDTNDVMYEEERPHFRYSVARWFRLPNSPYAVSPCVAVSNPDARTLQSMTWSIMQAGELAVEPPLAAQAEVVLGPVNLFPGGTTWVDKRYDERLGEAIRPIQLGKVPEMGVSLHGALRDTLGEAWYINKLYLPTPDAGMTATETERRWQEFLRVTQPLIEPAEPEVNGGILDVSLNVALDAGLYGDLSDMPEELADAEVDYAFDNPIEDARKQGTLSTFQQSMEITAVAAEREPTIQAQFNLKKAYRDTMDALAPAEWLRDEDDETIKEDEQRLLESAEAQAAMMEAAQGAAVAKDIGQSGLLDAQQA